MRVGAVTVNYNAGEHLVRCVRSLKADRIDEIVVVDNGSDDDSLAKLESEHPDVRVIHMPNPGLGAATNAGVATLDVDAVFILNPDTEVRPGTVDKLKAVLEADGEVAIVGPRVDNPDGSRYPSVRRFPSFLDGAGHAIFGMLAPGNRWTRRYRMDDMGDIHARYVDWVSGSAMFTRKSAFESVGGFDEGYFMYMEDTDLCWRLHKAGWKIYYQPDAVIMHVQGVSTSQLPYKMLRVHHQSLLRYHSRNAQGVGRLLTPLVAIGLGVRLPVAIAQRYFNGRFGGRTNASAPPPSSSVGSAGEIG